MTIQSREKHRSTQIFLHGHPSTITLQAFIFFQSCFNGSKERIAQPGDKQVRRASVLSDS
ncbi:hypothetical protein BO79DRAFT_17821 [Aspergillus costaricaensis CBS 115574]|uniref:Uncharacterized protein n=1 Tax=Aspergillus costaricaensis CBS 115574 TaxID=1448317 RepID=A0ACD1IEJ6_9EURO|nr:hypothetical protein BO79DRAFT_17821 [Aspergillus costaricaensis CBS 115574]RAK88724.1 hypothetical protein BO79DRAFT_17821 [Aspergillus costaricaensis CBS 115574]